MKTHESLGRSMIKVGVITGLILMVPLVAMLFTDEVKWDLPDFIIMGLLLFGTGISYKLVTRGATSVVHKAAIALAVLTGFLMIWANLAVGLIGSGPNPGNLMYIGVLLVGVVASVLSHFKPEGMERAMYTTALALVLHTAIALLAGMHEYQGSSVNNILAVNGFFAALFFVSGWLFRHAAQQSATTT